MNNQRLPILLVSTAMCLMPVGLASPAAAQDVTRFTYRIAAQPLGPALKQFARENGVQVLFAEGDVVGRTTQGLTGRFTHEEALARLLGDSRLTAQMIRPRVYVIRGLNRSVTAQLTPAAMQSATAQDDPAAPRASGQNQQPSVPDQATTSEEVVVTGIRASLGSAQAIKRNSPQVVDSIVAEDIGKLPDNNAAEALARVTGVQVERSAGEANRVLIRGLDTFVTTVNGREIFTTVGRRVAIQDFPADALAGIDVYKSVSADLVEGGIAGLVNIRLRRPLDFSREGLTVSGGARVTYATQAREADPIVNLLVSTRWETGVGEMGFLINGSYTRRHYFDSTRFDNNQIPVGAAQQVTPASVGRDFLYSQFNGIFYDRGTRQRPAVNASYQWRPSSNLDFYADFLYEGYRNRGDDDFIGSYLGNVAVLENVTLVPSGETARSLTATLVNLNGPAKITERARSDTYQGAIGGNWTSGPLKLSGEFTYTKSLARSTNVNIDTAFRAPPRIEILDFNRAGGVDYRYTNVDLLSPASYQLDNMYDARAKSDGDAKQVRLDARYELGTVVRRIDVGFRYQDRSADYLQGDRRGGTSTPTLFADLPGADQAKVVQGGFVGSSVQRQRRWLAPSFAQIRRNLPALRSLIFGTDAPPAYNPLANYSATEKTTGLYAQAAYEVPLGDDLQIDGLAGVRYVRTKNGLDSTTATNGVLSPSSARQSYDDWLPSVSGRVRIGERLQLRLAYSKTITRPEFSSLSPSIVVQNNGSGFGLVGYGGNPNLTPVRSTNYDATIEYYFTPISSVTFGGFWRDVTGFVTQFATDEQVGGQQARITRPYSAGAGTLKGLEASFTTFFNFLPAPFDGLGATLNGTYIEGKQSFSVPGIALQKGAFPGVSKYSYNLIGFYEKGPVSLRLAYNWRSRWISTFNPDSAGGAGLNTAEYTAAISRLDFSGSYNVNDHLTLTADATNLLGKPFRNYYGRPIFPRDVRYEDRVFSVGARVRF